MPDAAVSCLIGPGDSTKTTILDAIEFALSPRWSVTIVENDFYGGRFKEPIAITVTVGQLPTALLHDDRFGLDLRGWSATDGLRDEPEGVDEPVLTICFRVDDSREPTWRVVNDRRPEGRTILARDREPLGLVRLGGDVDRHLAWTRGSLLTRQTESLAEVGRVLAEAHREARDVVRGAPLAKLQQVAEAVQKQASQLGVRPPGDFRPALESLPTATGSGSLSLHADDIPVRALGLGSRRLVALALQSMAVSQGAIVLVDEVEHGLEPHRLRHLLRVLRAAPSTGQGQVVLTTHSSVAVEEMDARELVTVRSQNGQTTARRLSSDLQGLVRSTAEALLGHNILVCEGKTEIGLCRGLISHWATTHEGLPIAHTGTAFALGWGQTAPTRARQLADLGYRVALFADSDKPIEPNVETLTGAGVHVIQWAQAVSTEERIAADLPWDPALQEFLDLMVVAKGADSVLAAIRKALGDPGAEIVGFSLDAWRNSRVGEADIRRALGVAAKRTDAFKQVDPGQQLGTLVGKYLPAMGGTDLSIKLAAIAAWCYGE
jgi:hypothetical protein